MFLEDVGTLFVVDGKGCLFGVISRKDLLKASLSQGADLHNLPLAMVMTGLSKIVLSKPHEPAAAAARRLIEREVDCLPVVLPFDEKRQMETRRTRLQDQYDETSGRTCRRKGRDLS